MPQSARLMLLGVAAVAALAYILFDILHELGHAGATLLPIGIKAISISTVAVLTRGTGPVLAFAGPLVNLVLGLALCLVFLKWLTPNWRYFTWLLGTINLFGFTSYLLSSSVTGTGDWAKVFNPFIHPEVWRPIGGVVGLLAYIAVVFASSSALRQLCISGVIRRNHIKLYCIGSYLVGGLVLAVGSVFNPAGPQLILGSGVGTGFGGIIGLVIVPFVVLGKPAPDVSSTESLSLGWPWLVAGIIVLAVFLGVFGPGLRL